MKYITVVNGIIANNTYLLYNDKLECIIIDPSIDYELIDKKINEHNLNVVAILLTHAHYDHIYSVDFFANKYDVLVYCSNNTIKYLKDPQLNLSAVSVNAPKKVVVEAKAIAVEKKFSIGDIEIDVIQTYGHTKTCISFLIDEYAFTGDFVFKGTIGRVDFFDSSMDMMIDSIKRFSKLEKNYFILPGHGPFSTLEDELRNNKFFIKYGER